MTDTLRDYFDALDRLKSGKTLRVAKGAPINNDTVSLEAGRKKGSIKNLRPTFKDLIIAIDIAAEAEINPGDGMRDQLDRAKAEVARYRTLWDESLAREVSLVKELWAAREAWASERQALLSGKVAPFQKPWP
jgi:hypothetical protein